MNTPHPELYDQAFLQTARYETLSSLLSISNSILKNINHLEKRWKGLTPNQQMDREVCRMNKLQLQDEIDNRANLVPDHYLDELKELLNNK